MCMPRKKKLKCIEIKNILIVAQNGIEREMGND